MIELIAKIALGIMLYGFSCFVLVLIIGLLAIGVTKVIKLINNKLYDNEHNSHCRD